MAEHETGTPEENKEHSPATARMQDVMSTQPLKKCKVCSYQVRTKALSCPNCRALSKARILFYCLCILITLGFISLLTNVINAKIKSSKQKIIAEQYKAA